MNSATGRSHPFAAPAATALCRAAALALAAGLMIGTGLPVPAAAQTQATETQAADRPARQPGQPDFSAAERALFMSNQLRNVKAPASLRYAFAKSGSLEDGFDDTVAIDVLLQPDGSCCTGKASFLSGARSLPMPDLDGIEGNPVTMYFLERDVREMNRLTKGAQNYFRKRIRMAIYDGAVIRDVQVGWRGATVAAEEITIAPYVNDPNRGRYERLAGKRYQFLLSDAVPGGVYAIRSRIDGDAPGKPPLLVEELWLDGADRTLPDNGAPAR